MNIKTMITGLVLSLLLSSGAANADWGDVYYCKMTNFQEISPEGELKRYKLATFQFKLDRTKDAMVFGNKGFFKDDVMLLIEDKAWPNKERWFANDTYTNAFFANGKFLFSTALLHFGITIVSADCDKF